MKKLTTIITIITSILFTSCDEPINQVESSDSKIINLGTKYDTTHYLTSNTLSDSRLILTGIVQLDNCEYITSLTRYGYNVLTHKGNCNNPQHKCKCD